MRRFWRFFKVPVIVTAVAFVTMIVAGLVCVMWITQSGGPNQEQRAAMLGQGLATVTGILVAPFWIYSAYEAGKERREALKKEAAAKSKAKATRKKSR